MASNNSLVKHPPKDGRMEWISVKDRLPDECLNDDGVIEKGIIVHAPLFFVKVFEAYYIKGEFTTTQGIPYSEKDQQSFTHWMPLPEPPKEP